MEKAGKKAIGYVRVSTERQANEGVSLEAQKGKIVAWTTANDHELLDIHIDAGISGRKQVNRPGLQTALHEACKHKATLVVYSLSRLARSTPDAIQIAERLNKGKANLVSITEQIDTTTAVGRMFFGILAVLAQFESEINGERTKAAMAEARKQGRRISREIPYGYDLSIDGRVTANVTEQDGMTVIYDLRAKGCSLRAIAAELDQRGIKTKRGKAWTPQVISSILQRETKGSRPAA